MAFFQLIRFPNLLIVALTQYLLEYFILLPIVQAENLHPALDEIHFFLLVLSTIFIAAGGYIINDIEDIEIDKINKPNRMIIERKMTLRMAWVSYISLFISGLAISFYLAWHINNIPLVLIYPAAWALLWAYSRWFKKMPLIGNIVVAIFCAFVAGIVWFAEREIYAALSTKSEAYSNPKLTFFVLFGSYMVFAFLSTLYREIIKDMEDVLGDEEQDCRTFPILYGIKKSKLVAGFWGFLFLLFSIFLMFLLYNAALYIGFGFAFFFLLIPLLLSFYWLYVAVEKKEFHRLSQLAKYLMLVGILWLFFLKIG